LNTSASRFSAAVLISGGGSNLQAIIDACQAGTLDLELAAVLSNKPRAGGINRARQAGIPVDVVENTAFANREQFDEVVADTLERYAPDLLILAGFMRILSAAFVQRFEGKIVNIHPSLLPEYTGLHTHQRVLDAGEQRHGATVHFVTAELDGGPPIIQGRVAVLEDDDADTLAARVLETEHRIYPEAARLIASGRIEYRDGQTFFDGKQLQQPLQYPL
jgi:phosphoribosylglycinamide formyltransferase-1